MAAHRLQKIRTHRTKRRHLDATGVQDVYFEVEACLKAIEDMRAGKEVPHTIKDPGL
jgi:hypothetical protein